MNRDEEMRTEGEGREAEARKVRVSDFEVLRRNMKGAGGSGLDFLCTVVAEAIWLGGRGGKGGGCLEELLWGIPERNKRIAILSLFEIHKDFHQICN